MHVGLVLPSYAARNDAMQIPALSLLASALSERIQITIIPLRNPPGMRHAPDDLASVTDIGGAQLQFRSLLKASIEQIRSRHRERPFDLLHGYWLFEPGFVAAVAAWSLHIPAITSIGGAELVSLPAIGYGGLRSRRGRLLNLAVLRGSTLVTGGSNYVLDLARAAAPSVAEKLRLVPLPVETPACGENIIERRGDRDFNLLQVGAHLPVKGQDLSIRALAALHNRYPHANLTLIGEDPLNYRRRMADLAHNLGLASRVILLPRVPHAALAGYYRRADLLLMPSRHESQGMVVLEAATHGLPTVGSNVGVVGDLAPNAAIALPAGDLDTMSRQIASLLDDRLGRQRIGDAARQAVETQFGLASVTRRWIATYAEALDGK